MGLWEVFLIATHLGLGLLFVILVPRHRAVAGGTLLACLSLATAVPLTQAFDPQRLGLALGFGLAATMSLFRIRL